MKKNNTERYMEQLYQTMIHSNNGYHGSGVINLYQKNLNTGESNFLYSFSRRNPVKLIKYINQRSENWYTANSVSSSNRAKAHVVGFNMLFCDIDSIGLAHVSPEETYQKVLDCINDDLILTPSGIFKSGHGIHLVFLFKQQIPNRSSKVQRLWEKTELANLKMISKYIDGVDWKVKDVNRILRMPGSNNTKDYAKTKDKRDLKPARVLKLTGVKYDFWTVCESLVEQPEHRQRIDRYKAWKRHNEYQNSLNTYSKLKLIKRHGIDKTSLNLAHRIQSLIELVKLRDGHMNHYRNTILHIIGSGWLYVNRQAKFVSEDTQKQIKCYTWNLVKKVNDMFVVRKRTEVMKRFKERIMDSKFDINRKHNDFGKYCYSKKGMIKVLHIKPSEQWDLKYLRSDKVEQRHLAYTRKLNRYNDKASRRYASFQKRIQKLNKQVKLVHKMLKYRKQGYTYRQIANVYDCSVSHAYQLIKKYQYLAKVYESHKHDYQQSICKLSKMAQFKAVSDNMPNIINLTFSVLNRIRGSA